MSLLGMGDHAVCSTCSSYLDSSPKECCIRSCVHFVDKLCTPQPNCGCLSYSPEDFIQENGNGPTRQNACPHVRSTGTLPDLLDFGWDQKGRFVKSRVGIPVRSIFGPLITPDHQNQQQLTNADEFCNWMKFVRLAETSEERNMITVRYEGESYFAAIREISVGEELCVGSTYDVTADAAELPPLIEYILNSTSDPGGQKSDEEMADLSGITLWGAIHDEKTVSVSEVFKKKRQSLYARRCRQKKNSVKPEVIQCPYCDMKFISHNECKKHYQEHLVDGKFPCRQCPMALTTLWGFKYHMEFIHGPKRFNCNLCEYKSKTKSMLNRHMITHNGDYKDCPQCGQKFRLKSCHTRCPNCPNLEPKRVRNVLGKRRPDLNLESAFYKCTDCKLCFSARKQMAHHFTTIHPEVPQLTIPELNLPRRKAARYHCLHCTKASWVKDVIEKHMKSKHREQQSDEEKAQPRETMFENLWCEMCDTPYTALNMFINHINGRHPEYAQILKIPKNSDEPETVKRKRRESYESCFYKCRDCKRGFASRLQLIAHLNQYHPTVDHQSIWELTLSYRDFPVFRCPKCKKKSYEKDIIDKHVAEAHPEVDGSQEESAKTVVHNMIVCEKCAKRFTTGHYYLDHVRRHHPDDAVKFGISHEADGSVE